VLIFFIDAKHDDDDDTQVTFQVCTHFS